LTADPIGLRGGLNLYGYVGADPINSIDLAGLNTLPLDSPWDIPWEWPKVKPNPGILGGCIGVVVSILCSPTELNDGEDDFLPTIPDPEKPKCGCTCICRTSVNKKHKNYDPNKKRIGWGMATDTNCYLAKKAAKKSASQDLGQLGVHTDCKCAGK